MNFVAQFCEVIVGPIVGCAPLKPLLDHAEASSNVHFSVVFRRHEYCLYMAPLWRKLDSRRQGRLRRICCGTANKFNQRTNDKTHSYPYPRSRNRPGMGPEIQKQAAAC